jgi:hypothetical protein
MKCWRINASMVAKSTTKRAPGLLSPSKPSTLPEVPGVESSSNARSTSDVDFSSNSLDLSSEKPPVVARQVEPRRTGVRPKLSKPDAVDLGYKQRK